jgi:hypothetical protein
MRAVVALIVAIVVLPWVQWACQKVAEKRLRNKKYGKNSGENLGTFMKELNHNGQII